MVKKLISFIIKVYRYLVCEVTWFHDPDTAYMTTNHNGESVTVCKLCENTIVLYEGYWLDHDQFISYTKRLKST